MANISFCSFLGLLFGIQSWLYAEGQVRMIEKHALIGQQVNLTCYVNSTEVVTWLYNLEDENTFSDIYTCEVNQNGQCTPTKAESRYFKVVYTDFKFQATRANKTSTLSLTPSDEKEHDFKCKLGNTILKNYSVKPIDTRNIVPNCSVILPSSEENGVGSMTLSCEVNSGELDVNLTLKGIGQNVLDDSPGSSHRIKTKTMYFDDFNDVRNASCKAYFPDIDITRSCTYPNIINVQYIAEGNDIIVECDDESDVDHWSFYSSDGIKEDIENRSWIRKGGRSLLMRDISERDVGKVVVCRTKGDDNQTNNGTIGFTVISKLTADNTNSISDDPATTPSAPNAYFVPTLLFLTLWLVTTAVGGVWWGCTPKRIKSDTIAMALASGNASVPNGGSGELNIVTGARRDPDTSNTNNSAHNPVFEPEVNHTGENSRNRQSNNESHLYFTLEKSSPSPMNSLPRASSARWEHPDANPASLNHPQRESSHSQCYETVGEPNKGATSSYDLGEYAEVGRHFQGELPPDLGKYSEVGKHFQGREPPDLGEYAEVGGRFQGKGPPDLSGRPSIRKKPGREKVKGDDISSLYSKVNK